MSAPEYTYIEATSCLYGPDGELLREEVFCPKALHWNQLIADDPEDRSRGCDFCSERVMNLDVLSLDEVYETLKTHPYHCLFGSVKSIRFIRDPKKPEMPAKDSTEPVVIRTARTLFDINRAARSGFWPVVKLVKYDTERMYSKIQLMQDPDRGDVTCIGDYRANAPSGWKEVIPWTEYYEYFQSMPVAAYLIPKGLPIGTRVLVPDPIEDIVGGYWNQGDCWRAVNLFGTWDGKDILLEEPKDGPIQIVG